MSSIHNDEEGDIRNQKNEKTMCQNLSRIDLNKESSMKGKEVSTGNLAIVDDVEQQDEAMGIKNEPTFNQKTGWQKYFGPGGDTGFKCNDSPQYSDDDNGQYSMLYQIDEDSWESYFEEDFEDFDY